MSALASSGSHQTGVKSNKNAKRWSKAVIISGLKQGPITAQLKELRESDENPALQAVAVFASVAVLLSLVEAAEALSCIQKPNTADVKALWNQIKSCSLLDSSGRFALSKRLEAHSNRSVSLEQVMVSQELSKLAESISAGTGVPKTQKERLEVRRVTPYLPLLRKLSLWVSSETQGYLGVDSSDGDAEVRPSKKSRASGASSADGREEDEEDKMSFASDSTKVSSNLSEQLVDVIPSAGSAKVAAEPSTASNITSALGWAMGFPVAPPMIHLMSEAPRSPATFAPSHTVVSSSAETSRPPASTPYNPSSAVPPLVPTTPLASPATGGPTPVPAIAVPTPVPTTPSELPGGFRISINRADTPYSKCSESDGEDAIAGSPASGPLHFKDFSSSLTESPSTSSFLENPVVPGARVLEGQASRPGGSVMADDSLDSSTPSQSPRLRTVTVSPGIASNARLKVQLNSESCNDLLSECSPVEAVKTVTEMDIVSKYKNPIFGIPETEVLARMEEEWSLSSNPSHNYDMCGMCKTCDVKYNYDSDDDDSDATPKDITLPPVKEEEPEDQYFLESFARTFGALLGCQVTPLLGPRATYT